jgi:pimeloyl-ACP methyl ester carboxylesterase
VSDSAPRQPQQALDELIAQFEEEVRKRPTPAELAEAERLKEAGELQSADATSAAPVVAPASTAPMVRGVELEADEEADVEPEVARVPLPDPVPAPVPVPRPEPIPEPDPDPVPLPVTQPLVTVPVVTPSISLWWAAGERVELELRSGIKRMIFTRVTGNGPWLTLIHGFPTSSYDWAPVLPALAQGHRLLAFDLLGFGDSDKPSGHDWSSFEQADITEALWRHFGVKETRMVAHDVGMTVALELLARQEAGGLATRMSDYTLLNGGVYADFHRPRPAQVTLQRPLIGALAARMMSEPKFSQGLREVFAPGHQPSADEMHQYWESVTRRGGSKNYHRLIKYIPERSANKQRWESAVEQTELPIRFVWGLADPVSGEHMLEVIKERRPGADVIELAGVGHYPQLEAHERVAEAIIEGPHRAGPQ